MITLYVTSTETFAGKSAVCIALGQRFLADGFTVGYMKPVSTAARVVAGRLTDEDVAFAGETFGLTEPLGTLNPILLTPTAVEAALSGQETGFVQRLKRAYDQMVQGKDILLMEGGGDLAEGALIGLSASEVADLLGAKVLVIARYADQCVADDLLVAKRLLGEAMIGTLINSVPRPQMDFVEEVVVPYLTEKEIEVFAVLPRERVLLAVTVGELAEGLGGEILNCPQKADELVENLMVGAMGVDSALSYFRRKANKAVITGGDRADIQLAALETSTTCLILTGNIQPSPVILDRCEEEGVPMILARQDTLTAVEVIGQFFGKTRFHQEKKIRTFQRLFNARFDFNSLREALGLST
jgi:BioD-like phosphotransacetylase family protein